MSLSVDEIDFEYSPLRETYLRKEQWAELRQLILETLEKLAEEAPGEKVARMRVMLCRHLSEPCEMLNDWDCCLQVWERIQVDIKLAQLDAYDLSSVRAEYARVLFHSGHSEKASAVLAEMIGELVGSPAKALLASSLLQFVADGKDDKRKFEVIRGALLSSL